MGVYPMNRSFNLRHETYKELDNFFQSKQLRVSNKDYQEIFEKYKDNEKALLFLDPPYFLSDNSGYYAKGIEFGGQKRDKKQFEDPTKAYPIIRRYMKKAKCKVIMIINECSLLKEYFKKFYFTSGLTAFPYPDSMKKFI